MNFRSTFSLTSDEITAANERTIARLRMAQPPVGTICNAGYLVQWGIQEIMDYLGIVELKEDQERDNPHVIKWVVGPKVVRRFLATRNAKNRKLNEQNMKDLMQYFASQRWAITGETLIRDEELRVLSAQHRMFAAFLTCLIPGNKGLRFYFIVVDGIDSEIADFIDTGKSRDLKDISGRHTDTFLPVETLRNIMELPYESDGNEVRKKVIADIRSAMSILLLRGSGKDINASTTEIKSDKVVYENMINRFQPMQFIDAQNPPQTVETTELFRAANRIYALDQQSNGLLQKTFGRSKLLAVLILASNANNPSEIRVDKIQTTSGKEKGIVSVTYPETLSVDFDLLEEFCSVLKDKTGAFAAYYSAKIKFVGDEIKRSNVLKFGALVNMVKHFIATRSTIETAETTTESGEVIPSKTIVGCSPIEKYTDVMPKLPKPKKDSNGIEKPQPFYFPHFGGFDIGLISKEEKDSLRNNAVLEDLAESFTDETQSTE